MRITTWNVNGLRAALRKDFAGLIDRIEPDVLMLQEVRATPDQLPPEWADPTGWNVHWHPAEKKGYSGTATWSRQPQQVLGTGMDDQDPEGRILQTRINRIEFINVYLPSGSSSPERQIRKEEWMDRFLPWTESFVSDPRSIIIAGDLNIAHTESDIFYAKANKKTSGFLPHEREWFTRLLDSGWHDLLRTHVGDMQGPYSWWSNRGRARELDRGWRIDYLLGNSAAAKRFVSAGICREGGLTVSDHAPVTIELS